MKGIDADTYNSLRDCRCPFCSGKIDQFSALTDSIDNQMFQPIVSCSDCKETFPTMEGIPCFGGFETEDVFGLIEIVANALKHKTAPFTKQTLALWHTILAECQTATDKTAYIRQSDPETIRPYLPGRYAEWLLLVTMTAGLRLDASRVLDVGAGLGFDTYHLLQFGASVTAFEFSPFLARFGRQTLPEARWVCGLSQYLPFADQCFDYVFCNASLHHMRDVPTVVEELLRVLRPGGYFISIGDYCAPNETPGDTEVIEFGCSQGVLSGANERLLRYAELFTTLDKYGDYLDTEVFTLEDEQGGKEKWLSGGVKCWSYPAHRDELVARGRAIALRVKVKAPIPAQATRQRKDEVILDYYEYIHNLSNPQTFLITLAKIMPLQYIDRPFLRLRGSKFDLLNGWLNPTALVPWRRAYKRGRLFFSRHPGQNDLRYYVKPASDTGSSPIVFSLSLNGAEVQRVSADRRSWQELRVDMSGIAENQRYIIEIGMEAAEKTMNDAIFRVIWADKKMLAEWLPLIPRSVLLIGGLVRRTVRKITAMLR